jgi:hypothetical protein
MPDEHSHLGVPMSVQTIGGVQQMVDSQPSATPPPHFVFTGGQSHPTTATPAGLMMLPHVVPFGQQQAELPVLSP